MTSDLLDLLQHCCSSPGTQQLTAESASTLAVLLTNDKRWSEVADVFQSRMNSDQVCLFKLLLFIFSISSLHASPDCVSSKKCEDWHTSCKTVCCPSMIWCCQHSAGGSIPSTGCLPQMIEEQLWDCAIVAFETLEDQEALCKAWAWSRGEGHHWVPSRPLSHISLLLAVTAQHSQPKQGQRHQCRPLLPVKTEAATHVQLV